MKPCGPCEQYRREMGEALSQAAFIKAARVMMDAARFVVMGKEKEGRDAKASATTGE